MRLRVTTWLSVFMMVAQLATAQPTVRLEGRLIHVEGQNTGSVGISFGPFGTTVTRTDGFFTHVVPSETAEVTLEILERGWTVLYPRNGRIAVPRNSGVIVEVVAGDPIDQVITRTLAEKHQSLLMELTNLGAEQDQIRAVLENFLEDVKARLDLDEAEFRKAIDLAGERNERYPAIASALANYVLEARDVKDAFRLLAELAVANPEVVQSLDSTILDYNDAFETINNQRLEFEQAVAAYWQNERLTSEFRALMDYALGDVHRSLILRLNESLVGIHQLPQVRGSRRRERAAELSNEINRIVEELEPRLFELDRRTERMLQELFTE